jgi:hypothetical protein
VKPINVTDRIPAKITIIVLVFIAQASCLPLGRKIDTTVQLLHYR